MLEKPIKKSDRLQESLDFQDWQVTKERGRKGGYSHYLVKDNEKIPYHGEGDKLEVVAVINALTNPVHKNATYLEDAEKIASTQKAEKLDTAKQLEMLQKLVSTGSDEVITLLSKRVTEHGNDTQKYNAARILADNGKAHMAGEIPLNEMAKAELETFINSKALNLAHKVKINNETHLAPQLEALINLSADETLQGRIDAELETFINRKALSLAYKVKINKETHLAPQLEALIKSSSDETLQARTDNIGKLNEEYKGNKGSSLKVNILTGEWELKGTDPESGRSQSRKYVSFSEAISASSEALIESKQFKKIELEEKYEKLKSDIGQVNFPKEIQKIEDLTHTVKQGSLEATQTTAKTIHNECQRIKRLVEQAANIALYEQTGKIREHTDSQKEDVSRYGRKLPDLFTQDEINRFVFDTAGEGSPTQTPLKELYDKSLRAKEVSAYYCNVRKVESEVENATEYFSFLQRSAQGKLSSEKFKGGGSRLGERYNELVIHQAYQVPLKNTIEHTEEYIQKNIQLINRDDANLILPEKAGTASEEFKQHPLYKKYSETKELLSELNGRIQNFVDTADEWKLVYNAGDTITTSSGGYYYESSDSRRGGYEPASSETYTDAKNPYHVQWHHNGEPTGPKFTSYSSPKGDNFEVVREVDFNSLELSAKLDSFIWTDPMNTAIPLLKNGQGEIISKPDERKMQARRDELVPIQQAVEQHIQSIPDWAQLVQSITQPTQTIEVAGVAIQDPAGLESTVRNLRAALSVQPDAEPVTQASPISADNAKYTRDEIREKWQEIQGKAMMPLEYIESAQLHYEAAKKINGKVAGKIVQQLKEYEDYNQKHQDTFGAQEIARLAGKALSEPDTQPDEISRIIEFAEKYKQSLSEDTVNALFERADAINMPEQSQEKILNMIPARSGGMER